MSTEQIEGYTSAPAAADFSDGTFQYRAAVLNSSGQIAIAGAAAFPDGILKNEPKAGEPARIEFYTGIHKARSGAAILRGALLTTNASGRFVTATTGQTATHKAFSAASSADVIFMVKPGHYGVVA